jgi:hypothetical protein
MDPLSPIRLAMGLESVVLSAKTIVSKLFHFEAAKNAPEKSKELRREMHTVCDTLESLSLALPTSEHYSGLTLLRDSLSEFAAILIEMNTRVEQMSTGPLSWPFSKDENHRFLSKIGKYKESFTMTLSAICT